MDRQTAADLLDNLVGMVEDTSGNDYDTALKMGIEALKADAVEVVRCKDCKHKYLENMVWVCTFGLPGSPDSYCSYGERKDV